MERFGLVREGTDWVLPHPKLLRGLLVLGAAILLGLAGVGLAQTGFSTSAWVLLLFGTVGLWLLLTALRLRQSIDTQGRAFVWRGAFGNTVVPFAQIQELRPVHLTVNGAFQGVHLEARAAADQPSRRGRQVSPSFATEAEAHAYEQVLRQLMTS